MKLQRFIPFIFCIFFIQSLNCSQSDPVSQYYHERFLSIQGEINNATDRLRRATTPTEINHLNQILISLETEAATLKADAKASALFIQELQKYNDSLQKQYFLLRDKKEPKQLKPLETEAATLKADAKTSAQELQDYKHSLERQYFSFRRMQDPKQKA